MKEINLQEWKRKDHFAFFHRMDYPHYNVCFNLDITDCYNVIKAKRLPFYLTMIYLSTISANSVEEFRYRIRDGKVYLHDRLHPSFTYLAEDSDLFRMITVEMNKDYGDFIEAATMKIHNQKAYFVAEDFIHRDDYIYYTALPWISFTHLSHTINFNKNDSVPRLSWGKYFKENSRMKLPYSVQVNHALADGIHIGRFIEELEKNLRVFGTNENGI
ncbi:MAG: chloramphenicol acetyltransferase [Candidatus Delongbacteria bacterium]|nr:chloramphenicol acetyltransferase [Candidatus Delongbacteria bacterium]